MGRVVGLLLRVYSYLFHFVLALFVTGLGILALSSGRDNLSLPMLPWEGNRLTQSLIVLGIFGIVCVVLAIVGLFRYIFPIWALIVFIVIFRGYFLSTYTFGSDSGFKAAIAVTLGALLAFLGSLTVFGRGAPARRPAVARSR